MKNISSPKLRPVWCVALVAILLFCFDAAAQTSRVGGRNTRAATNAPSGPVVMLRHPNIILIVADDLGYGDLGCYGQQKIQTPNLDKLAAAGTRFTSFYAGCTVCAPSRSSLMTGQHTGHTRIRGNSKDSSLAAADSTLAQCLKSANYKTALIGKWALGNEGSPGLPASKGFDEFVGYLDQTRAHDYYAEYVDRSDSKGVLRRMIQNGEGEAKTYIPDLLNTAALNFIRINQPDQFNGYRPFFLMLAPTIPHANNELGARMGNGMQVPDDAPYSSEPWLQSEKNKAAMITRLDKHVGEILDYLRERRLDTNTLILFTSDNGPHSEGGVNAKFLNSAGPLRGIKRDLYEGGIRVPLLACWPGRIPAGKVSDEPWAFWDLFPTLAELAEVKTTNNMDGISYMPTLWGGAQTNRHEFLYWEFHERGFQQAARMGEWKAVANKAGEPLELYNLSKDIGETNNVAAANTNIVARFEKYLRSARTESPQWPVEKAGTGKGTNAVENAGPK